MTTPSQAKNAIRKALQDVLDSQPSQSERKRLREHFDNRCAFCGRPIDPQKRDGHIDHLVPTCTGGTNHISNRVLACNICNGDLKLDQEWTDFLTTIEPDPDTKAKKAARIQVWITTNGGPFECTPNLQDKVRQLTENVNQIFMKAVKELRQEKETRTSASTVRFCRGGKTASET